MGRIDAPRAPPRAPAPRRIRRRSGVAGGWRDHRPGTPSPVPYARARRAHNPPAAGVLRLTFDGTHCIGVVYRKDGAEHAVHANREVILCGGAINSPQLLMLSGIGPKEALQALGIDVLGTFRVLGRTSRIICSCRWRITAPNLSHWRWPEATRR